MTGTIPGQEPVVLITVNVMGVLIFVPLIIYLCVKVGAKPTLGLLTIGLRPRRRQSQRQCGQGDGPERTSDKAPPTLDTK